MKPSSQVALQALIFGAVIAGGLWWFLPPLHWAVYAVVAAVVAGFAYSSGLQDEANRKAIDGE